MLCSPGRTFVRFAAGFGLIGVVAGAFGAHVLAARLEPRMLEVFETAVRYRMYHVLALLGVAFITGWVRYTGGCDTGSFR